MVEVLERGDIQFWFRPSVQPAEAETYVLGVQAFYAILSPAGDGKHRRLRIGKKRLPAIPRERFWSRIERVGSYQHVLEDIIDDERYSTKTRGERYQPGARLIARGEYQLVRHDDHVHLDHRIDAFEATDEVELADVGHLLVLFEQVPRGRTTWTPHGGVAQLDVEGAELVLVGGASVAADDSTIAR